MADHDTHDHTGVPGVGTSTTTIATDTLWDAAGDLAVGSGANTAAKLAITVPAANILNVLGVVNGETTWSVKAVHDGTSPAAVSTAGAAGTSLLSAHRDHVHAHEAAHIAHDTIWDTAGDIVVGTGADTAAKLAMGGVGGAVGRVNGAVAWTGGTAFPTPATGDRFWRSDIGQEAYYDGTRWLSVLTYSISTTIINLTGNQAYYFPLHTGYDVYPFELIASTFPAGTNDGSNYWTISLAKTDAANTPTTLMTLPTTAADTDANWTGKTTSTGAAAVAVATYPLLEIDVIKTSSAGALYAGVMLNYKRILT